MVNVLVKLDDETNRVLSVVKARFMLRDKAHAIQYVVGKYIEHEEPELREDFVEKMEKIEQQPSIRVKDFGKRYGLKNVRA